MSTGGASRISSSGSCPVAEEYKVKLGCHPQDPGVPRGYRGIEEVPLATPAGLRRFVTIKESPYHGLNFCQGTVSEQLEKPGEQIFDVIRSLKGKIFNVHFRNIEGGYLNFRESFIDNGSVDMLKAARVYKEIGYDGMLMPDHVPNVDGDPDHVQGFAFALGYIKAIIAAVSAEGVTTSRRTNQKVRSSTTDPPFFCRLGAVMRPSRRRDASAPLRLCVAVRSVPSVTLFGFRFSVFVSDRQLNHFRQVQRRAAGRLRDLLAAAESVRDDRACRPGRCGRQAAARARRSPSTHRTCRASNPKGPAMPQQPASGALDLRAHFLQQRFLVGHLHERLVMAVPVKQHRAGEPRRLEFGRVALEEFAEEEGLPRSLSARASVGKQIAQLVAEHRRAARLEHHHRHAGIDAADRGGP